MLHILNLVNKVPVELDKKTNISNCFTHDKRHMEKRDSHRNIQVDNKKFSYSIY